MARAAALQQKLKEVHGISGRSLGHSLARARRVLPRHLRKAGPEIIAAEAMVGHPKLEPMIDHARLTRIFDQLQAELDAVDLADLRRGRWLAAAGRAAFALLVGVAGFIVWMVWAGHI